jgi:GAF domain-containing protein
MSAAGAGFSAAYAHAFRAYLDDETEASLRAAYELGRQAVAHELGLLELAHAHHEALLAELGDSPEGDPRRITRAAADFLLEAIAAYEMVRLGFAEAVEAVAFERRQAAMLRQLSTLLADASLAVHGRSSIEEVLQLVVEQARELTHAAWCLACAASGPGDPSPTVAHTGSVPPPLRDLAREVLAAVDIGAESSDIVHVETPHAPAGVLAVPLRALDGQPIGVLAVAPRAERPFSDLDKALLVHIAQMTAAAVERATRHLRHGPRGSRR